MHADVKTEIRAILAEQMALLEKHISDTAKLKEDLGLDSLDFVELGMEIEERYDMEVSEAETDKFHAMTVGELAAHVEKRVRALA